MDLKSKIRIVEDFPKEGISYKDITTLIKDGEAFTESVNLIANNLKDLDIDYIAGPEARGFIYGATVAYALNLGFIPFRKPGKLPFETNKCSYKLEYGVSELEVHKDAIKPGAKIAIVDDLLATGGTMSSMISLIEDLGAEVVALEFLIELVSLNAREKLEGYRINSLVKYDI